MSGNLCEDVRTAKTQVGRRRTAASTPADRASALVLTALAPAWSEGFTGRPSGVARASSSGAGATAYPNQRHPDGLRPRDGLSRSSAVCTRITALRRYPPIGSHGRSCRASCCSTRPGPLSAWERRTGGGSGATALGGLGIPSVALVDDGLGAGERVKRKSQLDV